MRSSKDFRKSLLPYGFLALVLPSMLVGCAAGNPQGADPMMQVVDVSKSKGGSLDPVTLNRSKAMHAFLVGQMAVHKDDYKGALKRFREVDKLIRSPSMIVKMKLARLQVQEGDLAKARIEAEKALKLCPTGWWIDKWQDLYDEWKTQHLLYNLDDIEERYQ